MLNPPRVESLRVPVVWMRGVRACVSGDGVRLCAGAGAGWGVRVICAFAKIMLPSNHLPPPLSPLDTHLRMPPPSHCVRSPARIISPLLRAAHDKECARTMYKPSNPKIPTTTFIVPPPSSSGGGGGRESRLIAIAIDRAPINPVGTIDWVAGLISTLEPARPPVRPTNPR